MLSAGSSAAVSVNVLPLSTGATERFRVIAVAGTDTVTEQTAVLPLELFAVTAALPPSTAVTFPVLSTVAMAVLDDDQTIFLSWVVLDGETVAVSEAVSPFFSARSDLSSVTLLIQTVLLPWS